MRPATRRRRGAAVALVATASVLALLAAAALWVQRQVFETDTWTQTSSALLENREVSDAVAGYLTDQLFSSVDVEAGLREQLPAQAQALAGPLAGELRDRTEARARRALRRPEVQQLWEDANRAAHRQLMAILLDDGGPAVSTAGGVVTLDLHALLDELARRTGVGARIGERLPAAAGQLEVMRSDQLAAAQDGARVLRRLGWVLSAAALILFGIALAVGRGARRATLAAGGAGLIAAGLAVLLARGLAGDAFVSALARSDAVEPAVQATWDISTALLRDGGVALVAYGVVVLAGAWLAGPAGPAVAVRRFTAPWLRRPVVAYPFLALIAVALLAWGPTEGLRRAPAAALLIALLAAGGEAFRRLLAREFPDAEPADSWRMLRRDGRAEARRIEQLERLAQLRHDGVLDDEETQREKQRILEAV